MGDSKRDEIDPATEALTPTRSTEVARLQVAQLTIESGMTLTALFQEVCRIASDTLNVARASVWMMVEQNSALKCVSLFDAASQSFSEGVLLHACDYPIYFEALKQRKIIPAEIANQYPLTSELTASYLLPLDIKSALDAPILVAGETVGVVCCEQVGQAREWTTEERDFVESIANMLATKIRAAEVHHLRSLLHLSEAQIARSEKSDALARMALGVAHDFRNILTVVQNCTEVILHSDASPTVTKNCDLMLKAVSRGSLFVKQLVEFGKSAPTVPQVIDVNQKIAEFIPIIRAALGDQHRLDVKLDPAIGKLLIDPNHFERILLNLVLNAKDALPNGGTIDLIASTRSGSGSTKHDRVLIEVVDTGCGMDGQTKERLFEPFFTTKSAGTGLGMPIVARFVERAGGALEVESTLGVGTTIRILLPLVARC